jgi:glycosyltransferase involved in cell wall biosynthesis
MPDLEPLRVGFVLKRYPRFSETFVVREILAHEKAGVTVDIFTLRPSDDGHFQDLIARVRGSVSYLYFPAEGLVPEALAAMTLPAGYFWQALTQASQELPGFWTALDKARNTQARHIYQAAQLACLVRRRGIQHLHSPFASDAATVTRLAAGFAGVSYSFTARAKDTFHEDVDQEEFRCKLREAAGVVTVSDYHLRYLRQAYGPLAANVQRIYNGLDLEEYPYQAPRDRSPIIVAVGRLIEKKGFADLIEACALLAARNRKFRCRIIGYGALQAALQAQIEQRSLVGRVEIVGALPQHETIREIRQAAVLAAPCVIAKDGDRDGLPNVIQEAMALGTPVVSTDVAGILEVVRHGETGLQVPQHDPSALAASVEQLLADPTLGVRLAAAARQLIEAEFNIHRNTERRRSIFRGGVQRSKDWGGAPLDKVAAPLFALEGD